MTTLKTWKETRLTVGVYKYERGGHTLIVYGTPPQVVFDLLHRGQASLGEELRGNAELDGELMSLRSAMKKIAEM